MTEFEILLDFKVNNSKIFTAQVFCATFSKKSGKKEKWQKRKVAKEIRKKVK